MASEAFSAEWANQWCTRLNQSQAYRAAASTWEGGVALVMARDGSSTADERAVYLDLWHGECRQARAATPLDRENARYVLTGTAPVWRELLGGTMAPLTAVMSGKLRLSKGSMGSLLPYAGAARELVAIAMAIDVTFPDGW